MAPKKLSSSSQSSNESTSMAFQDHCSQPTWSQCQFEGLMRIQRQREEKQRQMNRPMTTTVTTTPSDSMIVALENMPAVPVVTNGNNNVSDPNEDSTETTRTPSPYNMRMYKEYLKSKGMAESLDVAKVVQGAEVATGLRARPQ